MVTKPVIEEDTVTFSSGHKMYANCGIVGLAPDLKLYEGYDGSIIVWYSDGTPYEWDTGEGSFSKTDFIELADMMIERWNQFRAKVAST